MLFGVLSMAIMAVITKLLKQYTPISVFEVCYFRTMIMAIGCVLHSLVGGFNVVIVEDQKYSKWVFMRAVTGFLSFSFQFIGIYLMPLSIATVLYFTQPISAATINFIFNREKLSSLEIISIFSAMIGVVVLTCPQIIIPGYDTDESQVKYRLQEEIEYPHYYLGVFFSLLGSLTSGFAYLSMRKLGQNVSATITTYYFGVFGAIASFIVFSFAPDQLIRTQMDGKALSMLIAVGVFGWLAQEGVGKALQTEKAGRAASLNYLQVLVAFIADITIFGKDIAWTDLVGSILILIFTLINSLKKCF